MENYFMKNLKTCLSGAFGAMTFGMYHQYTTNKIMELNNKYFYGEIEKLKTELAKK